MRQKILFIFAFNFSFLFIGLLCLSKQSHSQDIQFDWKHVIGSGTSQNEGKSIAIDSAGYVYVGGIITGTVTFLDTTLNATGVYESFVSKLTPAGNLVWFKWFRSGFCRIESICIDRENKLYVTGIYGNSVSFDTLIHSNNTDSLNTTNMFIAKFDTAGALLWAKNTQGVDYIAGSGNGPLKKLTFDRDNNLIVTGRCIDKMQYFDTSAIITTHDSTWVTFPTPHWSYYQKETGFIAKYTSSGNKIWAKRIGGFYCNPYAVKTDNANNIIVTGNFTDTISFDNNIVHPLGTDYLFLVKFNSSGSTQWVQRAGGSANGNTCNDIAVDSLNNLYITGAMVGNNIRFGESIIFNFTSTEGFLAKYDVEGTFIWVVPIGTAHINYNSTHNEGHSIAFKNDTIYLLGSFMDTITYGNITLQSDGKYETFLMKLDLSGNILEVGQYIANAFTFPQQLALSNNSIYITGIRSNKILIGKIQNLFPVNDVEMILNNSVFNIYPNPSTGIFYINTNTENNYNNYDISIFDLSGKIILSSSGNVLNRSFDISEFNKGLYFVRISDFEKVFTYKLIIE